MQLDGFHFSIGRAFLESGKDLVLQCHKANVVCKHPCVGDILQLGNGYDADDIYWGYVSALLSDPYDNMVWLDDHGIDYEDVDSFDVFCLKWKELQDAYELEKEKWDAYGTSPTRFLSLALQFFLGHRDFALAKYDDGEYVIIDEADTSFQIDRQTFSSILLFITLMNGIVREGRIRPKDKNAKMALLEDKRDELKKLQKKHHESNDRIGDMMSVAIHAGAGGITPFNVSGVKIYQLYSEYIMSLKKNRSDHILNGIYAGTVDGSKINPSDTNWM